MPTAEQLASLYRISYQLTFTMLQPIHLICVDAQTRNAYILAGYDEELEFQILPIERYLMSRTNYDDMSDAELKQYFLKHRSDQTAFQAHLDRINQRPRKIIASSDDPDFDEKVQAAIRQKLEAATDSRLIIQIK